MKKVSIIVPVWNQEELVVRCLDSIPRRDDIQVIAFNDGSTDRSLSVIQDYKNANPELDFTILSSPDNKGVSFAKNQMLRLCVGEYFNVLDSDDYLYTKEYERIIDNELDGTDIVCFNLKVNNGSVWKVEDSNKQLLCGQTIRFVKRSFADGIWFPNDQRIGADWFFNEECLKRNPTHKFTDIVAYHYNHPRKGSNMWIKNH